jgi:hypothetical protein
MPKIEYADPLRNIGIALDRSFSHNGEFEEDMGCAIRHYQHLGIDADSHPMVIKMEKELGKNLLEIARLTLVITLKAVDTPSEEVLHYSDQGNKISHGMKIGSFCLGYCLVSADNVFQRKTLPLANNGLSAGIRSRVSKLYAAACTDNYGHERIMRLSDYGNKQTLLLRAVKHEIAKYKDTLGLRPGSL